MGVRGCELHPSELRVEWAQTHSAREVLDRQVRLAEVYSGPAAVIPRRCKIWIERERLIDESGAVVEFADHIAERVPTGGERCRIVPAQRHGTQSQPRGFCNL